MKVLLRIRFWADSRVGFEDPKHRQKRNQLIACPIEPALSRGSRAFGARSKRQPQCKNDKQQQRNKPEKHHTNPFALISCFLLRLPA
jgi:hypothetical protein